MSLSLGFLVHRLNLLIEMWLFAYKILFSLDFYRPIFGIGREKYDVSSVHKWVQDTFENCGRAVGAARSRP